MNWIDVPVLVTGSSGFVGAALCQRLYELGADVIAYDIQNGHDVLDWQQVESVIQRIEPQVIYHLAAQTQVTVANRYPYRTFETNIVGTANILEAARICKTPKVIIASSDKAYGSQVTAYTEASQLEAVNPYDVSKACADHVAQSYIKTYGMNVSISRFCNIYGPGDLNWRRLIPGVIRDCIRGRAPVLRSSGAMVREYVYIDDCIDGYLKLAEADPGGWNFGGEDRTVLETCNLISAHFEGLEPVIENKAYYEIDSQRIDDTCARKTLHWSRKVLFCHGINKTIAWYKEYLK